MKIGLNEGPWESMRTPEEVDQERDREAHLGGYCLGAPACWHCQEEHEQAEREATPPKSFDQVCQAMGDDLKTVIETWENIETLVQGMFGQNLKGK